MQHLPHHSLWVVILVSLIAGWLAGVAIKGSGFGPIGDVVIGWLGALIGNWLLPRFHIHLGAGIVAMILHAVIGAVVLLFIIRLLNGEGILYKRRWGRRW